MIIESQLPQDSLVTITVDKVGLITMISAAHKAIKQTNEWNLGDEYDTDITPFHDMKDTLIEQYHSVYGDDEWKSALAE
tara:strand:+ start:347 stop:583 length:237 start_codon:yes stop_codon:yes gene_type:complete